MVASKDNNRADSPGKPTRTSGSPTPTVDEAVRDLVRLLGRQAAREAFRAARAQAEAQAPDPASPSPATGTDEE